MTTTEDTEDTEENKKPTTKGSSITKESERKTRPAKNKCQTRSTRLMFSGLWCFPFVYFVSFVVGFLFSSVSSVSSVVTIDFGGGIR